MYRIHLLLLPICLLFFSCQDNAVIDIDDRIVDNPITEDPDDNSSFLPNVEDALKPYFVRFQIEAEARGRTVTLDDLIGHIESIPEENVAGQCTYHYNRPNVISVDAATWNRLSDLYREFIVFHELGHCVLARGHDESTNSQGLCLSIMRSGLGDCRDAYSASNREYYLDELFYND